MTMGEKLGLSGENRNTISPAKKRSGTDIRLDVQKTTRSRWNYQREENERKYKANRSRPGRKHHRKLKDQRKRNGRSMKTC